MKIVVALICGIAIGIFMTLKFESLAAPEFSHAMEHAYRYGCVESGESSLNECGVKAKGYRDGLAMFLDKFGFQK